MTRRYHIGLPFLVYCGLMILVAVAAVTASSNLLYWVFGVMASALLISGVVSGIMLLGLDVRRVIPADGAVGETLSVRYAVHNRNRLLPVFNVHFEEVPVGRPRGSERLMAPTRAWVMHIGPGEEVHGESVFQPQRRGEAWFDEVRIGTSFPFGIIGKSITSSRPQRMLIYPRLHALRHGVLEGIAPPGLVGTRITQHAGAGDDFYGLREFRVGDSLRHIAWKRTANRDQLLCVERTSPSPPKMRVMVNLTAPPSAPADAAALVALRAREERAIELAASIVHAADAAAFEVGLTILGPGREPIAVRRSHRHRQRIMAALAEIDLDAERGAPAVGAAREPEHLGIVVVHPGRPEPGVVRGEAWHFSAEQMDHLVEAVRPASPAGSPAAGPRAPTAPRPAGDAERIPA